MYIAVPSRKGLLFRHFGQSREFTILQVDELQKKIISTEIVVNEKHEHGFPHWLFEHKVDIIIAGNIGEYSIDNLKEQNIAVVAGAKQLPPEKLVLDYLEGNLYTKEIKSNYEGRKKSKDGEK
jgi:predicted Fe-Mo cluster-binding NifX family protein